MEPMLTPLAHTLLPASIQTVSYGKGLKHALCFLFPFIPPWSNFVATRQNNLRFRLQRGSSRSSSQYSEGSCSEEQ